MNNTATKVELSPKAEAALVILQAQHYEPTAQDLAEAHAMHLEMEVKFFTEIVGVVPF